MTRHCPNEDCPGLARDGIVAEYVDTMEACVDCGARLIPGEALPEPPPPLEYNEDAEIPPEAEESIRGALRAGMSAHVEIDTGHRRRISGILGPISDFIGMLIPQAPLEVGFE